MSTRSRRGPGSPPDKCTCRTPSPAASPKTRTQVAVSSSSSLASSASGLEQYGQPSGQRWVSSASRPSGLCTIAELDNATRRLIQCSGQACRCASPLATCGTARSPGQARVPFAIPACATRLRQRRGTSLDKRGYGDSLSHFQEFFVRQTAQQRADVREDFLARRRIGLGEVIDEFAESDLAGAALDDLGRDRVGLEDPLGRKQHPAALRLVVDEPNAPRQPRARVRGDDGAGIAQPLLPSSGTKAPGGICFGAI